MFGSGDAVTAEILRAASSPATTTTSGWAKELAGVAILDLVQSITSISAAAEVINRGLKVNLDGVAELRVPGRVLNAAAAGQWVASARRRNSRPEETRPSTPVRVRSRPPLTSASSRVLQSPNCSPGAPHARLCQRDHAAPELLAFAGVDVVFAHEREPAIAGEAIDHDPGGQRLDRAAVAHRERSDARRHQKPPA